MVVDKLTKIEFSSDSGTTWTDISGFVLSWKYVGELNNTADKASLQVRKDIKDTYTLRPSYQLRIYEGWTTSTDRLIFKGQITRMRDDYSNILIECADDIYKLLKANRVKVYNRDTDPTAGKISAIAEDLMDEVIPTTVEDSGTTLTIRQFITSNKTNVLERVTKLADSLNWIILYDPEVDSAYFVSRGYFDNPRILNIPTDVTARPKWDEDATRLVNELTFIGGTVSGTRIKLFDGDNSTLEFEVDFTPSDSVFVEVDSGAGFIEQTQGTQGVSSSYDYYIDKANKKIVFLSGSVPPTGTENVRITISAQIPPTVRVRNEESITTYNNGTDSDGNLIPFKMTIVEDDITSNEDAIIRANELVAILSTPFLSTNVILRPDVDKIAYYKLGERIFVTDSDYDITEQEFIITKIERFFPGGGAKITIGDEAYRLGQIETDLRNRINKLEERLSGDTEILADYRSATREMDLFAKSFTLTSNSVAGDNLIWDHPIYGNWDEQKWAPDNNEDTGGFILGHPIYGVLGTSKLGAGTDNDVILDNTDYE